MGELLEGQRLRFYKGLVYNVLAEFPKEIATPSAQPAIQA